MHFIRHHGTWNHGWVVEAQISDLMYEVLAAILAAGLESMYPPSKCMSISLERAWFISIKTKISFGW